MSLESQYGEDINISQYVARKSHVQVRQTHQYFRLYQSILKIYNFVLNFTEVITSSCISNLVK